MGVEFSSDPNKNEGQQDLELEKRALGYYFSAQKSLSMYTMVDPESTLYTIGKAAKTVLRSSESSHPERRILPNMDCPPFDGIVFFSPETTTVTYKDDEDENVEGPLLTVEMRINLSILEELEQDGLTAEQIRDIFTLELVRENHIAQAYLSGEIPKKGLRAVVTNAVEQQQFALDTFYDKEEFSVSQDQVPFLSRIVSAMSTEERVREYMSEPYYYATCTFDVFQKAALRKLDLLNEGKIFRDDLEERNRVIDFLQILVSHELTKQLEALEWFLFALFEHELVSDSYDSLIDSLISQSIAEECRKTDFPANQLPSYEENGARREKAVAKLHAMTEEERMIFAADAVVGAAIEYFAA